jgi:hypothetical protein
MRGQATKYHFFSTGHLAVKLKDNLPMPHMAVYHAERANGFLAPPASAAMTGAPRRLFARKGLRSCNCLEHAGLR